MNEQFKFEIKRKLASALSSVGGEWGNNNMVFCDLFFRTINICFNNVAYHNQTMEETDTRKFKFFIISFLNEDVLENVINHPSLRNLYETFPLIQDDRIITQTFGDISEFDPGIHFEVYEKSSNFHNQFNKEYSKCIENFTISKAKRVIEKLCALLWTVRSNLAHGSKVDLLGKLERNLEVCDVIFHVLLNLIDAILEFSSHKIAVYGELRKSGSFHDEYMKNMKFISHSYVLGSSWYEDSLNTMWVDVGDGSDDIQVEIYEFNDFKELLRVDRIEMAFRKFVPYFDRLGNPIGFCWIYSRSKKMSLNEITNDNETDESRYQENLSRGELIRTKCKSYMISIFMLEKNFFSIKPENFKHEELNIKYNNFEIRFRESGPFAEIKNGKKIFYFFYVAELANQMRMLRNAFDLVWGSDSDGFQKYEKALEYTFNGEVSEFEQYCINTKTNPADKKLIKDANTTLIKMLFEYFKAETCKICNDEEETLIKEVQNLFINV